MNMTLVSKIKKHRNGKNVAFTFQDPPSTMKSLKSMALDSMFKGVSRNKRENILSGVRDKKKSPPVGLYTPKYNFVQNDSHKGLVKFDSSPKGSEAKHVEKLKVRRS